ncbi:hypothetical protein A3A63_03815 [Candidatus Gottesmanbacteria bacterium RIFCSPLOWO2_01_FULL_46_9]|uniref:Toxin YoeB n=1 Tax=Candidatus Gottesmanbacteria bacterium RIFCSPLOWO2_01_FULL_46_9 TaxID=1798394 RepID=A0A1F6AZ12_9BACT|nr:MAG: hypothetical protein A3A63_03815 [Candidatus Gottesmanbacteria bacterium RIFCSPLOWO2_01_FULL_46_9]
MPYIRLRPSFTRQLRKFTKKNIDKKEAVKEALRRFSLDPDYPSLHLEKLSGQKMWTMRIDSSNRLFFVWSDEGDAAIFFYVGSHDAYRIAK